MADSKGSSRDIHSDQHNAEVLARGSLRRQALSWCCQAGAGPPGAPPAFDNLGQRQPGLQDVRSAPATGGSSSMQKCLHEGEFGTSGGRRRGPSRLRPSSSSPAGQTCSALPRFLATSECTFRARDRLAGAPACGQPLRGRSHPPARTKRPRIRGTRRARCNQCFVDTLVRHVFSPLLRPCASAAHRRCNVGGPRAQPGGARAMPRVRALDPLAQRSSAWAAGAWWLSGPVHDHQQLDGQRRHHWGRQPLRHGGRRGLGTAPATPGEV